MVNMRQNRQSQHHFNSVSVAALITLFMSSSQTFALESDSKQAIMIDSNGASYDEKSQLSIYTGNVIAIVLKDKTCQEIGNLLEDPITQIYGSLFRIDRNTSAAHFRMFSYDMDTIKFNKDLKDWASNVL